MIFAAMLLLGAHMTTYCTEHGALLSHRTEKVGMRVYLYLEYRDCTRIYDGDHWTVVAK